MDITKTHKAHLDGNAIAWNKLGIKGEVFDMPFLGNFINVANLDKFPVLFQLVESTARVSIYRECHPGHPKVGCARQIKVFHFPKEE